MQNKTTYLACELSEDDPAVEKLPSDHAQQTTLCTLGAK